MKRIVVVTLTRPHVGPQDAQADPRVDVPVVRVRLPNEQVQVKVHVLVLRHHPPQSPNQLADVSSDLGVDQSDAFHPELVEPSVVLGSGFKKPFFC